MLINKFSEHCKYLFTAMYVTELDIVFCYFYKRIVN